MREILSKEAILDAQSRRLGGESVSSIAKSLGVGRWIINSYCRKKSDKRTAKIDDSEVCSKYVSGMTIDSISASYGVSHIVISHILRSNSIPRRSPSETSRVYELNKNAFSVDSPEASYWTGFLFADGSVSGGKLGVYLSSTDIGHLEKLRAFLGSNHPIRTRPPKEYTVKKTGHIIKSGESARLMISSPQICEDLESRGVSEGKHKRFASQKFADDVDFWRGVVDGDGCLGITRRNSLFISVCGSADTAESFLTFIRNNCGETRAKARPGRDVYTASAVSSYAYEAVLLLYGSATVFLDRKMEVAQKILSMPRPRRNVRHN